jgi:phage tail sheath protein FI
VGPVQIEQAQLVAQQPAGIRTKESMQMAVRTSYPGVYIEEIPSGVHTITGVATSITAFVGRASRGRTDTDPEGPVVINSFADFERSFGGLGVGYPLSYAVRDFYLNGGQQAVIVRVFKAAAGQPGSATLTVGGLTLEAASPGGWGNALRARIDDKVSAEVADQYKLPPADLFNLRVRDMGSGITETFLNVTVVESPRRVDRVVKEQSALVRVPNLPATGPQANADPAAGKSIWDDDNASTKVADADRVTDGQGLAAADLEGDPAQKTGLHALDRVDLFNLLCIPPDQRGGDVEPAAYQAAMQYCVSRRAMLIVDPPSTWTSAGAIAANNSQRLTALGLTGQDARNAALYYPRVIEADPQRRGQLDTFVPCGVVAGVMARTDATRGVWKAPAGVDAALNGTQGLSVSLTNDENGMLNPLGINVLRTFPVIGSVAWGARTLRGADLLADEYKYVPVRRLALYIEESLYRGTQWVVFEPNDEPLWASIRLAVGAFMHNLFRQGAFQGQTPQDAYFVKCDKETTIQNDINLGIVNIRVGFAPLKPAEFVIIQIQQMAGQVQA